MINKGSIIDFYWTQGVRWDVISTIGKSGGTVILGLFNPNPDGYKKCVALRPGAIYDYQATNRKQGGSLWEHPSPPPPHRTPSQQSLRADAPFGWISTWSYNDFEFLTVLYPVFFT